MERYGQEATDRWCAHNDEQAPLAVACKASADSLRERLLEQVEEVSPVEFQGRILPDSLLLQGLNGPLTGLPGFQEGEWWVMDPAAIATADLLAVKPGERVLDFGGGLSDTYLTHM